MAFALVLPEKWAHQGWKVKIRDDERNETPHATFLRKRQAWRLSLRTGTFLDSHPHPAEVPAGLVRHAWSKRQALRTSWDAMYPENPVFSQDDSR